MLNIIYGGECLPLSATVFQIRLKLLTSKSTRRLGKSDLNCGKSHCFFGFGLIFFFFFGLLKDRIFLCILGYQDTSSVEQAGLKLRELPAPVS